MECYKQICSKKSIEKIFINFKNKSLVHKALLNKSPVDSRISLNWCLKNRSKIASILIKGFKDQNYFPNKKNRLVIHIKNKERIIYLSNWIDKIVESLVCEVLNSKFEGVFSDNLFSYRKGRSNFQGVKKLSSYIKKNINLGKSVYLIKKDIKNYTDTINLEILNNLLKFRLNDEPPYFFDLINSFMHPNFWDLKTKSNNILDFGLPTGTNITNFCGNLYLNNIDNLTTSINDGLYLRYGDDILYRHTDQNIVSNVSKLIDQEITKLGLSLKEQKESSILLSENSGKDNSFIQNSNIDYLGFNIDFQGKLFLSNNRIKRIKKELLQIARSSFLNSKHSKSTKSETIKNIIDNINFYLNTLNRKHLLYDLINLCDNTDKFQKLDKWIAKLPLRFVYKTNHDRVFKHISYKEIRKRGLISIFDIHNRRFRN